MKLAINCFFFSILLFASCTDNDEAVLLIRDYDFSTSSEGWIGDFADYPLGEEAFYELEFGYAQLPLPLDITNGSLLLSGNNHSDDLFMFVKKQIEGLEPNRLYSIKFDVQLASDAAGGSVGVGGSPAESMYLKAGAAAEEPLKILDATRNFYQMNIDKGNQAQAGLDMINIGNFSNGTMSFDYTLINRSNTETMEARSDNEGKMWLAFGADSAFEATSTIYIDYIHVELL